MSEMLYVGFEIYVQQNWYQWTYKLKRDSILHCIAVSDSQDVDEVVDNCSSSAGTMRSLV